MKVALVLNTYNEGSDVRRTIESARQNRGDCELDVVVVADGTSDGSCDDLGDDVLVLKTAEKVGIGKAKSIGVMHAEKRGAHVILHMDAHNRISKGTVHAWAALCLEQSPCIVTPPVGPLTCAKVGQCDRHATKACTVECADYEDKLNVPRNCYCGGRIMEFSRKDARKVGLFCDNTIKWPEGDVIRTQAVNPSTFGYSIETLKKLAGWNRYPGWWGSQEIGISLRAWFTDTPILVYRKVCVLHRYRSWNEAKGRALAPYAIPNGHRTANWMYAHRVVFDKRTWQRIWIPWFARWHKDDDAVKLLEASPDIEQQQAEFAEQKVKTDEQFFKEVLNRPYPLKWRLRKDAKRAAYCIGGGLGNALMCIPAIKGLAKLSGGPVDLIDKGLEQADGVKELFEKQPWIRKMTKQEPDFSYYKYILGSYWARGPVFAPIDSKVAEVSRGWRSAHEVELNFAAARKVGYVGPTCSGSLTTFEVVSGVPEEAVAVGVGCAGFKSKRWPHWDACCRKLHKAGVKLVFLGTGEDDEPWMDSYGMNLCGQTSIAQAAGVLWTSRLYLGIDNGLSHVAAAVRTPIVALYGPSSERKNRPWATDCTVIRADEYDCAPCWDHPREASCRYKAPDERPCMAALSPEYVAARVLALLGRPAWESGDEWPLYLTSKQPLVNMDAWIGQEHGEFCELLRLIRRIRVKNVIEIGCADGGWLGIVAGAIGYPVNFLAIDPDPNSYKDPLNCPKDFSRRFNKVADWITGQGHEITHIPKLSAEAFSEVEQWTEKHGKTDILHIDGNHDLEAVAGDWERYKSILRPGGLVVFHDIAKEGPRAVFERAAHEVGAQSWRFYACARRRPKGIGVVRLPGLDGTKQ